VIGRSHMRLPIMVVTTDTAVSSPSPFAPHWARVEFTDEEGFKFCNVRVSRHEIAGIIAVQKAPPPNPSRTVPTEPELLSR
jgi:hypothetical protein